MLTLHYRVAEAPPGQDYPITLLLDTGQAGWEAQPIAQGTLPRDLAVAGAPEHPDQPGTLLTVATALAWYQAQAGPSATGFERVGALLFRLLDQPAISVAWKAQRDAGWGKKATGESLRTILTFEPSVLRDLPWELVNHKQRYFFTEAHGPWYRGTEAVVVGPPIARPVKVLLVIGCQPTDKKIRWREEVQAILDVTCPRRTLFDVEVLEQPSVARLTADLATYRPDVLHFVGHGIDGDHETTAGLEIWSEGVARTWTAREMFQLLSPAPPRLAFVNACRTAEFVGERGGWRVASALRDAGVPAVIGMQGDVLGDAAALLSRRIYEQLASGVPIDAAVSQARLETMQAPFGHDRRDWSLLTLTLGCPAADVLAMEAPPPTDLANLAAASDSILSLAGFVGRRRDRREVRQTSAANSHLLVLAGGEGIGKSDFLKTCLEQFALHGARVVYVDLATGSKHDAIGLLRLIRGPKDTPSKDLLRPNLYAQFADFNEELNALLDGLPPPVTLLRTEASGTDSEKPYRVDDAHHSTLKRAFETFGRSLMAVANGQPLYLVVDHLDDADGGMPPELFTQSVRPFLVDVVARKELGSVRLVLALRDDQVPRFGLSSVVQGDAGRALLPFARGDWRWLSSEYLLLRKLDRKRAEDMIERVANDMNDDGFGPDVLEWLAMYVRKIAKKPVGP
ncbi:MAG: CHAT domain-containing protein [Gemmatimonadaceae bacterium]|nr:CHAT domain-containing protein [Gemmatimonadaceae bacterium]